MTMLVMHGDLVAGFLLGGEGGWRIPGRSYLAH
jgi:hypothetical protein